MAESVARERWAHTSSVLAMLANTHRDPKKTKAFRPADFNPFEAKQKKRGIPIRADNIGVLRALTDE